MKKPEILIKCQNIFKKKKKVSKLSALAMKQTFVMKILIFLIFQIKKKFEKRPKFFGCINLDS
jgi:hypothetical protein